MTLDLAGSYRSVADTMLPHATQVADPFHVIRAANERLDDTRRRVQQQVLVIVAARPIPCSVHSIWTPTATSNIRTTLHYPLSTDTSTATPTRTTPRAG